MSFSTIGHRLVQNRNEAPSICADHTKMISRFEITNLTTETTECLVKRMALTFDADYVLNEVGLHIQGRVSHPTIFAILAST